MIKLPEGMTEAKGLEDFADKLARFCNRLIMEEYVKYLHDNGLDKKMSMHTMSMNTLLLSMEFMTRFTFHVKFNINKSMYAASSPEIVNLLKSNPDFMKFIDDEYNKLLDDINEPDKKD